MAYRTIWDTYWLGETTRYGEEKTKEILKLSKSELGKAVSILTQNLTLRAHLFRMGCAECEKSDDHRTQSL